MWALWRRRDPFGDTEVGIDVEDIDEVEIEVGRRLVEGRVGNLVNLGEWCMRVSVEWWGSLWVESLPLRPAQCL